MDSQPLLLCLLLLNAAVSFIGVIHAQHESIPYENIAKICDTCVCLSRRDNGQQQHHVLSCATKNFKHILARWPPEFGVDHTGIDIVAVFSGNSIDLLQQLPATNASLTFACRECSIWKLQVPTFMDVPNIKRLDLSWNEITTDELTPDVFRGPYRVTHYEPIGLVDLDLSHNKLNGLDKKLFEHTPQLAKLKLSHNKLTIIDGATSMALASAGNLEILDLSYTRISTISTVALKGLVKLKELYLAGNAFTKLPDNFQLIGRTLQVLDLSTNLFDHFNEQSFLGLKALKRLNISDNYGLEAVQEHTFTRLETLEYVYCSHNQRLRAFDLDGLMHSRNLTQIDISHNFLSTLTLNMNLSKTSTNSTLPRPWAKLHVLTLDHNPWMCDCELFQTLEFIGSLHRSQDTEPRCDAPYPLAGQRLSNYTAEQICAMQIPKKFRVVDEDPPRFLRKRYIILTAITASVVIVIGLLIGFLVAFIRRRLKRDDYGLEPIRYTSVRCSNLSAFNHPAHTTANTGTTSILNGNTNTCPIPPANGKAEA